ncbi:MAG: hypothetical protein CMJ78_20340 [Planctomycetaceae bacterium]|nr:hypothetical protein [Planctomycetaceae bacterium]
MQFVVLLASLLGGDNVALAAGDHFSVYASTQSVADAVLQDAETAAKQISQELFGKDSQFELSRTIIYVRPGSDEDYGKSVLRSSKREANIVWLYTIDTLPEESTMRHELVHCALASRFRGKLPTFIHEGLAAKYDAGVRRRIQSQMVDKLARTKRWVALSELMKSEQFDLSDARQYATSMAFVQFLLSEGDQQKLFQFGVSGNTSRNWTSALADAYDIPSINNLEQRFHRWTRQHLIAARPNR